MPFIVVICCLQVAVKDPKLIKKLKEHMPDYEFAMTEAQRERRLYKEASAMIKIREGKGRDGIRHFKNAAVKLAVQNLGFLRAFVLFTTLKPEDISFAFIWSEEMDPFIPPGFLPQDSVIIKQ